MRQIKVMQYCKGAGRAVSRSGMELNICNDLTCVSCKGFREAFDSAASNYVSRHLKSSKELTLDGFSVEHFAEKVKASFTDEEIEELREKFKNVKIESKLRKP